MTARQALFWWGSAVLTAAVVCAVAWLAVGDRLFLVPLW